MALTESRIEQLVATAPQFIDLSLPSLQPTVAQRLLPGHELTHLVVMAEKLVTLCAGRIPVTVIGLRTSLDSPGAAAQFKEFWRDRRARSRLLRCHSRGGHFQDQRILMPTPDRGLQRACGLFARHAFITWKGDLLACCHDLTGQTRLGNVTTEQLSELNARKAQRLAQLPHFELCEHCDEPLRRVPLPTEEPPRSPQARQRYFRWLGQFL